MFHEIVRGMFEGYKAGKGGRKQREWEFNHLEQTDLLYGSDFLWEKYHQAETEEDYYKIMHHMVKHRTGGIESYDKVYGAVWKRIEKLQQQEG